MVCLLLAQQPQGIGRAICTWLAELQFVEAFFFQKTKRALRPSLGVGNQSDSVTLPEVAVVS